MYAKFLIIPVFLLFNCICFSQAKDSIICSKENIRQDTNVTAFIKEKRGEKDIKWNFFYKEFELKLSDPSFEIVQFSMSWDIRRENMIVHRINYGSIVTVDLAYPDLPNKENYSFKSIEPGSLIAFDGILIKKDGICYQIPSFIVQTIL